MILPDVNVLIYAFRPDAEHHLEFKAWLTDVVNGTAAYGVSPQVLSSLIRITTHPRIYRSPSSIEEVFSFCNAILEAPNATIITPQDRHWSIFQTLCAKSKASGNLIPDAWFAALAIEAGCEWITTDGDFARFDGLLCRRPFELTRQERRTPPGVD